VWLHLQLLHHCCVLAVYELLTALLGLELALLSRRFRNVCLTQHQFRLFKTVVCFRLLRKCYLDKEGTLLFHNNTMQRRREKLLPVPNHLQWQPDILSALMRSTYGTRGPVITAKQTSWMCRWHMLFVEYFIKSVLSIWRKHK